MSLFNVCTCWSTQCADLDDNYDSASLLCSRFGLEKFEKDYIIVGSHAGNLSIFYPNLDVEWNGNENYFKPTDLLLEITLPAPILGIYSGKFSSNLRSEDSNHLAVLHPNSLAIYNIKTVTGVAEHGTQLRLQLVVEHKFDRCAFSFCKGHFGQVKGREFFCIVHIDGTLTFYEQDGIIYECQFPGQRALPTPIAYCERSDNFFRFGAEWHLECYSYQDLVHSSMNNSEYHPVWSVCIGEGIIDINVVQVKSDSASIMVLGEHNLISLNDNGKINFILKLDFAPKCFFSFVVGYYWEPSARLITAIVSESSKLFIYEEANIIWASQCQFESPVAIQRSNLCGLAGGIVTLSENGLLRIGYLGSEPYVFKPPPLNLEELSFAQAYKELQELENEIKAAADIKDLENINRQAAEDVSVMFSISSEITEDSDAGFMDVSADVAVKELPACTGKLKFSCKVDLAELQVTFNMADGLKCNQSTRCYTDILAGRTETLDLEFYIAELFHIHSAQVDVIISFINIQGVPRVIQKEAHLPLSMFFKVRQPQKTANIKVTYNITSPTLGIQLATFFPDFVTWESNVQTLGLVMLCPGDNTKEEIVTILTGKTTNRIRVQSDHLEAFPMILERISKIANDHQQAQKVKERQQPKVKQQINTRIKFLSAIPAIPIQEILHRVDIHHETQENIRKQMLDLDELYNQFKDLQQKQQDKSDSAPQDGLVMQIEENYDHLIAEGDRLMEIRKDERKHRCDLSCSISTARWIINYLPLEERVINVILSVLVSPIEDWEEMSWEESTYPGLNMLHHYGPISRVQSADKPEKVQDVTTYEQFDYNRFRLHFVVLLERIIKLANTTEAEKPTQAEVANEPEPQKSEIEGLQQLLTANSDQAGTSSTNVSKQRLATRGTLEAVEDDEDEYDEEDLREVGYKKDLNKNNESKSEEGSEWVNDNFELPTSEALFNDLGIWW